MARTIPFYANTDDDTHCFQAAIKMVLGYFEPETVYDWDYLDNATHKLPDMWTWTMAGLLWLHERGYEIRNIEDFDYATFSIDGYSYLLKKFGVEIAVESARHSDIDSEMKIAEKFHAAKLTEPRLPDVTEIHSLLDNGWLLIANVNARALNEMQGYVGHFVLITDSSETEVRLHDPGLPASADRKVSMAHFKAAWEYPDDSSRNLIAVRRS